MKRHVCPHTKWALLIVAAIILPNKNLLMVNLMCHKQPIEKNRRVFTKLLHLTVLQFVPHYCYKISRFVILTYITSDYTFLTIRSYALLK